MSLVVVTGGGGFLGRRIVELCVERGDTVRFLARGRYPEVEALGAEGFAVDLRDAAALVPVFEGADVVYHAASKAGVWGDPAEFHAINVDGTRNVIAACQQAKVPRLVYTSTPSVIGYGHDACGIEAAPYPATFESPYGETKALAEQAVLAANSDTLKTVSLRPHLIIGPRDNNLLPRVVARAREGRLRIIGDGENQVDLTYVDNAAWAHLDAGDALAAPDAACAGKAYFISNDEPVRLWEWTNTFLGQVGVPAVTRHVSLRTAVWIGSAFEWAYRTLPLKGEPRMTGFMAMAMARSHWYSMAPAKRDFGYKVRVSMAEATERTAAWFNSAGGPT